MQAPHKARPSGRQARPSTGVPVLSIKYDVTEDLPDGQAWPPDGDGFWSAVSRADGCTRWRRIALITTRQQHQT